jgi:hypothetical protein
MMTKGRSWLINKLMKAPEPNLEQRLFENVTGIQSTNRQAAAA